MVEAQLSVLENFLLDCLVAISSWCRLEVKFKSWIRFKLKKEKKIFFFCKGHVFLILHGNGSHIKPACPKEQSFFI